MIRSSVMNALAYDLQEISASVMRMLSLVKEENQLAQKALIEADVIAAERCVHLDEQVDALMTELEQRILTVIARRQPAAKDLRFLGAIYRALADIERAGDYASHVAKAGASLADEPPLKKYTDMNHIMQILTTMIEMTIHALADSSVEKAKDAHKMDKQIDDLYEQIQRELLTYMMEQPGTISIATRLLAVARNLERFGDHLENVNEHIIFWLTNERYEG
ncbi:MAG: phosphate signaling complex protein PhoU [Trueperaceae bacterium]|nr:phosphate signaling complex protein PhoU [Trueperaceae bacterium]